MASRIGPGERKDSTRRVCFIGGYRGVRRIFGGGVPRGGGGGGAEIRQRS